MGIQVILRCICVNMNTVYCAILLDLGEEIAGTFPARLPDAWESLRVLMSAISVAGWTVLPPHHHHSFRGRRKSCRFYEGGYNGLRVAV